MNNERGTLSVLKVGLFDVDVRDTSCLRMIYDKHQNQANFLGDLIDICATDEIAQSATWLMKRHLESGCQATSDECSKLVSILESASDWQTKLHILQSIRYLKMPSDCRNRCYRIVRGLTLHHRPFVRAWAYDAVYAIGQQDNEMRQEAMRCFHNAESDSSASVRARFRNIVGKFTPR